MSDIHQKLSLQQEHLVALALLIGCDYGSEGVKGIGKEQAVKMLQRWDTENPLERYNI